MIVKKSEPQTAEADVTITILKEVFHSLGGMGNFNRYQRQAIFLYVFESNGKAHFANTCRLLGFNECTAKQWYNPCSTVYSRQFVEVKDQIKGELKKELPTGSGKNWRNLAVYRQTLAILNRDYGLNLFEPMSVQRPFSDESVLAVLGADPEKWMKRLEEMRQVAEES
jgi:hypothetical protein